MSQVQSAQRVIAMVRLLAELHRPIGVREIAQALGSSPSNCHRLLVTLIEEGWVEQDPASDKYQLSVGILGTAAAALTFSRFIQLSRSTLAELSESTGLNSHVSVLVGPRVAYLAAARGIDGYADRFRIGKALHHAHAVADGKILLAFLDSDSVRRLYAGLDQLRRFTPRTLTSLDELEEELTQIRVRGYATDFGERLEDTSWVAAPVRGKNARVVAALLCGGRNSIATPDILDRLVQEVSEAAEQLSIQLGLEE